MSAPMHLSRGLVCGVLCLLATHVAAAQSGDVTVRTTASAPIEMPSGYAGPPPPVAPATVSRDGKGHLTLRALRLTAPLRVDGALDEALYRDVEPVSDFLQTEPSDGQPAKDQTQMWLSFDDDNIYISVNALDSDMEHIVANEMRRDGQSIFMGNDFIAVMFDTFYDRRNALFLCFNPLAARYDGQVVNERSYSGDWNPVWSVRTKRNANGWTAEAAVPFKSIRYQSARQQVWGVQVQRMKRSKNELSFLSKPPKARLMQAYQHVSDYATLVGLEAPLRTTAVDIKPYIISDVVTDATATPRVSNDPSGDFGVDAKVGITRNLAADLTYNTDFAQVEADEQQVNLTRFGLFFPEKRDFFLENAGTFTFGGISGSTGGDGNDAPLLFYSRRIGLSGSRLVPIDAGGRLTGRVGKFAIGAINMQAGEEEVSATRSTNFSVLRVKRDILRRSSLGVIFTGRSVAQSGIGSNQAYGVDGTFGFFQNLSINTFWARTETPGRSGNDDSYRVDLDYNADRYGLQLEHLDVGANFNPEVGFARRLNLRKDRSYFRFSPRAPAASYVRKYYYEGRYEVLRNREGVVESKEAQANFQVEFKDAARINIQMANNYEHLLQPFRIASNVTLPVGEYSYNTLHLGYLGPQAGWTNWIAGGANADLGTFYNGRKYTFTLLRGKVSPTPQLSIEPRYVLNAVRLVEGNFTSHLSGARVTYTMTPMMFTSALLQYNTSTGSVSANVRLRWEYQPGSELFIVFNEDRDARMPHFPALNNRAFIVKFNRLFRL